MTKQSHDELLEALEASLTSSIHYYNAVLEEVQAKKYTIKEARADLQSLLFNEGTDIIAILQEMSDGDGQFSANLLKMDLLDVDLLDVDLPVEETK